jgi:hypothetical protein
MPPRLDIPTLFANAGIPLNADAAMLQVALEQRGWQVQVEEPLRDDVRRSGRQNGNRYRALGFRVRRDLRSTASSSDHAAQSGLSPDDALRKLLASVLQRGT